MIPTETNKKTTKKPLELPEDETEKVQGGGLISADFEGTVKVRLSPTKKGSPGRGG